MYKEKTIEEMKLIFKEAPYGIEHTMKVLKNAEIIMEGENLTKDEKELIAIVAILHDIGVLEAQKKYGSMAGNYQEIEGPEIARKILERIGYDPIKIDRVCFIVGNHHTPSKIDGLDFQIQWEADLLENLRYMEVPKDKNELKMYIKDNFKTVKGLSAAYSLFEF